VSRWGDPIGRAAGVHRWSEPPGRTTGVSRVDGVHRVCATPLRCTVQDIFSEDIAEYRGYVQPGSGIYGHSWCLSSSTMIMGSRGSTRWGGTAQPTPPAVTTVWTKKNGGRWARPRGDKRLRARNLDSEWILRSDGMSGVERGIRSKRWGCESLGQTSLFASNSSSALLFLARSSYMPQKHAATPMTLDTSVT
jgi:hypothetical protein